MLRTTLAILALAALAPAHGARIFKCEGADGSVTFTTTACPDNTAGEHYATYTPQPDAPARFDDTSWQGQDEGAAALPGRAAATVDQGRAVQANLAAIHGQDPRSTWGNMARSLNMHFRAGPADKPGVRRAKAGALSQAMNELEAAARGGDTHPPRMLGDASYRATLLDSASRGVPAPAARPARAAFASGHPTQHAPPEPPVRNNSCKQSGNSVTCYRSDGTFSHGSVDAFGNGSVRTPGGDITRIQRRADGTQRTSDGTCIRDMYGQCQ